MSSMNGAMKGVTKTSIIREVLKEAMDNGGVNYDTVLTEVIKRCKAKIPSSYNRVTKQDLYAINSTMKGQIDMEKDHLRFMAKSVAGLVPDIIKANTRIEEAINLQHKESTFSLKEIQAAVEFLKLMKSKGRAVILLNGIAHFSDCKTV